jgi:TRAP transporter TAXI family solute receptor
MKLRARLVSLRDLFATAWPIILLSAIGFAVAFHFVQPSPPRHVTISAGAEGGAYYAFAGKYKEILARKGIELEVLPSSGSVGNLERLRRGDAQIGFLQGGVLPASPTDENNDDDRDLRLLGSVFYEPIWVFYRGEQTLDLLHQLAGRRIAVGEAGSGARALILQLLAANGVAQDRRLLSLGGQRAADALLRGRIDALIVVSAPEAGLVQKLLRAPGVRLMSFAQAEAYPRHFPYLSRLVMPRGGADLVRDVPPQDSELLAATANLVVRDDLHPAVQSLLLEAANEVHGRVGFFQKAGEFPAYKDDSLPLSDEAARYYRSGPPFLQRYLPFWLAVLVDRLMVLLLPLVALLLPLLKVAPSIYSWRVRSRIFRCYGELKFLENDLRSNYEAVRHDEYRRRLDEIDETASRLAIPLAFSDLLYTLREHINLVRRQLSRLAAARADEQGEQEE